MNLLIIALASTNANTVIENKIGNANSMYAAKTAEDRRQGGESLILLYTKRMAYICTERRPDDSQ